MTTHASHTIRRSLKWALGPVLAAIVVVGLVGPARAADPVRDTVRPTAPGRPVASVITTQGFTLAWTASTDNVGVDHYRVSTFYPPGSLDPRRTWLTPTNSITITDLYPGQTVPLVVEAFDAAGNTSPYSPTATVRTAGPTDLVPPSTPGTPTASGLTCDPPSMCSITLSWTPSTDNVGVLVYGIRELAVYGGVTIGTSTTTSATIRQLLTAGRTYVLVIFAMDPAHNRSPESSPVTVVVPPVRTPSPSPPCC